MIQKITQNNWNFWTVNLIMRAKKLLTNREIFRYAVPARTVTKKHCLHVFSSTHLQVRSVDGFSRFVAQTTRTRARMCLLEVFDIFSPRFRGELPPKLKFWGVNRRFQAKQAKYWKFHVIETTASILIKFGTTIVVIADGPSRRPTNPRWRTAAILKKNRQIGNRHIFATVRQILMRFGTMTYICPWQRINR